jgi:hypothetical protein
MKFSNVVKNIIPLTSDPMIFQKIRDQIKMNHPDFYGNPVPIKNIEKGHYKDSDYAFFLQIYTLLRIGGRFPCDKNITPIKIS